jgi:acetolactate synthase-1/3 small subunit
MRHVLSATVQNVPGVLAHISGMLASRGYNIDSLAVGTTENPDLSRMTFVIVGDDNTLSQVRFKRSSPWSTCRTSARRITSSAT